MRRFCLPYSRWVDFGYFYQTLTDIKREPVKLVYQDGVWEPEKINWAENLKKLQKGKENLDLTNMFYGVDGCLYLCYAKTTVPFSYEAYVSNPEAYEDIFYDIGQHLYRVNEKTGEVNDLKVPLVKGREVYGDAEYCPENLVVPNYYAALFNGDYVVRTGNLFAVYNGKTGEKRKDIDCSSLGQAREVFAGDDFICWYELNRETMRIEIHVCDTDGKGSYVLDTQEEAKYSEEEGYSYSFALGVKENTIITATSKGIFEAEYEEDELHKVVEVEKDNLYYLGSDSYVVGGQVYKGADGRYFLQNMKKNGEKSISCFYGPLENQGSGKKP